MCVLSAKKVLSVITYHLAEKSRFRRDKGVFAGADISESSL